MRSWLPTFSVRRPVTVAMGFVALVVLGLLAWTRIPLEMMPSSFTLNRLWVWVPYDGSSPRENEQQLVRPLEEQLATSSGIKSMTSRARSGSASLSLEFHRSTSMAVAYNAVVDRMERAMAELPDDVERYWIWKFDPASEPVMWAGIAIPDEVEDEHKLVTEFIEKRLERVPGVGEVDVWGVTPRAVFIDFQLDALLTHGVSLGEVIGSLGSDNFQMASGKVVDDGKVRYVRSLARWESIEELKEWPVKTGVTLSDIAKVRYRLDPSASINHINGKEGAALAIQKESDANTVEVTEAVEEAFAAISADPRGEGVEFVKFFSQGDMIGDSVDDLLSTAATGGVCAVIVLFMFLREWRLTLLIALCIPVTLLLTVTMLYFTGFTLNLLTLMGLMLAVGMVVDNAIVVVESIYARRQAGEAADEAAIDGASDVNLAITLSTLTTMVVFLPVILMSENADFSFFMGQLGMPVVWALAASLFVALVFTPLSTTLLRGEGGLPAEPRWITWLTARYRRSLGWVLTHRTDALVGVLAATFLTFAVPAQSVSCDDAGENDVDDFMVRFELPGDWGYYERLDAVEAIEGWVDDNRDRWGVRTHRSSLDAGSEHGRVWVYLDPPEDRPEGAVAPDKVMDDARESLPVMAGVDLKIGWGGAGDNSRNELGFVLNGEDTPTLELLGGQLEQTLEGLPGIIAVRNDLEGEAGREMRLQADRASLARYGLDARTVGQTVGFALRGTNLPKYHDDGKEVDVVARFQLSDREDVDRLLDFPLWSPAVGRSVPLRAVVQPEVAPGFGTIRRTDRITSFPMTIELEPGAEKGEVMAMVGAVLGTVDFPRGYSWSFGRERRDREEDDQARNLALLLSITFVYLIMGVLFESWTLPLSILTSIPMALVGVYWTLYLTGTPLDAMGGVGLVILVGVVVNNGIVLIDLVTRLRGEGEDRTHALVEAGARRLRPILMTALTTIFGLLPMALGTSTFVGIPYAPLGRVVAGGLLAGTVLTLYLVPYLYSILDDMGESGRRWAAWVRRPAPAPSDPAPGAAK
jgi:HAE1 family hydrophobic/amphiphilic exporter-1